MAVCRECLEQLFLRVGMSSTPTLPVVDVWKGYDAIARWCRTNGHTLSRTRWEVYGDWDEDPASVQTAVYWVLES